MHVDKYTSMASQYDVDYNTVWHCGKRYEFQATCNVIIRVIVSYVKLWHIYGIVESLWSIQVFRTERVG